MRKLDKTDKFTKESLEAMIELTNTNIKNRFDVINRLKNQAAKYAKYDTIVEKINDMILKEKRQLDEEVVYINYLRERYDEKVP